MLNWLELFSCKNVAFADAFVVKNAFLQGKRPAKAVLFFRDSRYSKFLFFIIYCKSMYCTFPTV